MSIQKKMLSGAAVAIMLIVGLWIVGSFYALLTALTHTPPDIFAALVQTIFVAVGCIILGWYVTSKWYRKKV